MDKNEPSGLVMPNVEKIACRCCKYGERGKIAKYNCAPYPKMKPHDVCFNNIPCPKFELGEDLLPYEIEI